METSDCQGAKHNSNSIVAMVTDLWRVFTFNLREAWYAVYAMLHPINTVQILCIGTDRSANSVDQNQTASEEAV